MTAPPSLEDFFSDDEHADTESLSNGEGPLEDALTSAGVLSGKPKAGAAKILRDLAPIPTGGWLLAQRNTRKIFKAIEAGLDSQERIRKNREEESRHWDLVLEGCQFSILEKSEDQSIYKQLFPPGVSDAPQPIPNKVADLKRKIISQILVDKFLPDPRPDGANSDRNRGAADLLKKMLRANAGPTELDESGMLREALDINSSRKSAFVRLWVDEMGGGWRPMQKLAHPRATDANHPLIAPKLGPDGQPVTLPDGTVITERSTDPILRYIAEAEPQDGNAPEEATANNDSGDGTATNYVFTDDPSAAARQWTPKMRRDVLMPSQVALFPVTSNAWNARSITLLLWQTLGEAKDQFPILRTLDTDQLKSACQWRPKNWKSIVPEAVRPKGGQVTLGGDGAPLDQNLFFWYHHYCRIDGEYVDGAEISITGGSDGRSGGGSMPILLRRTTLREDVELDDGTTVPVLMDPPVVQFKGYNDVRRGDSLGRAPVSEFGGSYELYAHIYTAILEGLDKALHPNVYFPSTSPINRQEYNRRDGTPIEILVPEDAPIIEAAPVIPPFAPQIIDKLDLAMNSAAGTNETSNGLDSSYSESGIAKDVAIRQAKVSLMQLWENTSNGMQQFWRIETQLAQAKMTVPMEVQVGGTESAFKQKWFVGADLIGVGRLIPLAAGSGTMQSPMEKLNLLSAMVNASFLDKDRAGDVARSSMSDDLGIQPDVHEERVDRQIGIWMDGPPPEYEQQRQAIQKLQSDHQATIQHRMVALTMGGMNPQLAAQQAQQDVPAPQIPTLWGPFEPRANDGEPGVAKTRALKLSRLISTPDYEKQPDYWRALVDAAYAKAFYDSGGQTVEQAAAVAQAAKAATQQGINDATYAAYTHDIVNKVMALSSTAIAKTVASQIGATPPPATAAPAAPTADPAAELAAQMHDVNTTAATTTANATADRAHQAEQAALDRTHEAQQNELDRGAEQRTSAFKAALDAHTKTQANIARERQQSLQRESTAQPS